MKKAVAIIGVALAMCAGSVLAQSIEESLDRLRAILPSLPAGLESDEMREYAAVSRRLVEQGKNDAATKDRITREIAEYTRRQGFDLDPSRQLSDVEKYDYVYVMQLVDILTRIDPSAFLDLNQELLGDSQVGWLYKLGLFREVFSTRVSLRITDPNALPAYDRGVLSLGMGLIDREDGLRLTFGQRTEFQMFVNHLIGYELPSNLVPSLPPIDREQGLKFAREFVNDDRFDFVAKEWYMGQLARFDAQVREEYVGRLKAYMDDTSRFKRLRVKYAETLAGMGQLDETRLEALRNLLSDPNAVRIEIRNGEVMPSEQDAGDVSSEP